MNRLVWYPALISIALLGLAVYFSTVLKLEEGLPLTYLYVGATLPVALLLLRQALDFSYKEELVINTLADYVEQMRTWAEEIPAGKKTDPVLQEEVIDRITSSIKQTAASGSHFSKMLTPEEEKIMREIISGIYGIAISKGAGVTFLRLFKRLDSKIVPLQIGLDIGTIAVLYDQNKRKRGQ